MKVNRAFKSVIKDSIKSFGEKKFDGKHRNDIRRAAAENTERNLFHN